MSTMIICPAVDSCATEGYASAMMCYALPGHATRRLYYRCPEVLDFVNSGQGSAETAAAAMVAFHAAHPALYFDDSDDGYYDY